MFGDKNINNYEYQPIVREVVVEEEVVDDEPDTSKITKQVYKQPYIKLKIDLEFSY